MWDTCVLVTILSLTTYVFHTFPFQKILGQQEQNPELGCWFQFCCSHCGSTSQRKRCSHCQGPVPECGRKHQIMGGQHFPNTDTNAFRRVTRWRLHKAMTGPSVQYVVSRYKSHNLTLLKYTQHCHCHTSVHLLTLLVDAQKLENSAGNQ